MPVNAPLEALVPRATTRMRVESVAAGSPPNRWASVRSAVSARTWPKPSTLQMTWYFPGEVPKT